VPSAHVSSLPYNDLDTPEEETSAGTSSSASEKKLGKNGTSGTPDLPSPVLDAESLSEPDPALSAAPSSSASSTDGSTQETTPSQPVQPDSSEAPAAQATLAPSSEPVSVAAQKIAGVAAEDVVTKAEQLAGAEAPLSAEDAEAFARDMIQAAREAYERKDYDTATDRLSDAEKVYPPIKAETVVAHAAIQAATKSTTS
jgi:hypothetical protein